MIFPALETVVEILLLAVVNYVFIRHLQSTRGGALLVGFILIVLLSVALFGLAVTQFSIPHIRFIADKAMPSLALALLVLFQPELRMTISRIGSTRVVRIMERILGGDAPKHAEKLVDSIVVACQRMSKRKTGALIVVQNKEGIEGFTTSGTAVNADVSASLIETIFYKGTPLHDGALLISNGRAMWAGCHLPLSESGSMKRDLGTRHCAALGMSEESDALVIVVSEETGRISVAKDGNLYSSISITELREWISAGIETQLKSPKSSAETETSKTLTTTQMLAASEAYENRSMKKLDVSNREVPS